MNNKAQSKTVEEEDKTADDDEDDEISEDDPAQQMAQQSSATLNMLKLTSAMEKFDAANPLQSYEKLYNLLKNWPITDTLKSVLAQCFPNTTVILEDDIESTLKTCIADNMTSLHGTYFATNFLDTLLQKPYTKEIDGTSLPGYINTTYKGYSNYNFLYQLPEREKNPMGEVEPHSAFKQLLLQHLTPDLKSQAIFLLSQGTFNPESSRQTLTNTLSSHLLFSGPPSTGPASTAPVASLQPILNADIQPPTSKLDPNDQQANAQQNSSETAKTLIQHNQDTVNMLCAINDSNIRQQQEALNMLCAINDSNRGRGRGGGTSQQRGRAFDLGRGASPTHGHHRGRGRGQRGRGFGRSGGFGRGGGRQQAPPCRDFQNGRCSRGQTCRFTH